MCSACGKAYYCDEHCQYAHHTIHAAVCRAYNDRIQMALDTSDMTAVDTYVLASIDLMPLDNSTQSIYHFIYEHPARIGMAVAAGDLKKAGTTITLVDAPAPSKTWRTYFETTLQPAFKTLKTNDDFQAKETAMKAKKQAWLKGNDGFTKIKRVKPLFKLVLKLGGNVVFQTAHLVTGAGATTVSMGASADKLVDVVFVVADVGLFGMNIIRKVSASLVAIMMDLMSSPDVVMMNPDVLLFSFLRGGPAGEGGPLGVKMAVDTILAKTGAKRQAITQRFSDMINDLIGDVVLAFANIVSSLIELCFPDSFGLVSTVLNAFFSAISFGMLPLVSQPFTIVNELYSMIGPTRQRLVRDPTALLTTISTSVLKMIPGSEATVKERLKRYAMRAAATNVAIVGAGAAVFAYSIPTAILDLGFTAANTGTALVLSAPVVISGNTAAQAAFLVPGVANKTREAITKYFDVEKCTEIIQKGTSILMMLMYIIERQRSGTLADPAADGPTLPDAVPPALPVLPVLPAPPGLPAPPAVPAIDTTQTAPIVSTTPARPIRTPASPIKWGLLDYLG